MSDHQAQAQAHLLPHFTKGAAWRSPNLGVIERGEGCYVWDTEGTRYLDALAGLFCTNIGHGRTDLTAAATKQMEQLAFFPTWGWANPPAVEAATLIADRAPGDLSEVFFVSSGSEAVESALKFARNYHLSQGQPDRYKVIAREWAYHGTTLGALSVTGIPKFRDPFLPMLWDGVRHADNTLGRSADEAAASIEQAILAEGPETVSMVIAEPVQNGRGALVPPDGYWQQLRSICDRYGILLVADEVINSFGRLGHWFGSTRMDVVPDMITFAKGVTSAYQPLGGMIVRGELVDQLWDSEHGAYMHGSTFGGHPVATAVAVANITAMSDEDLPGHVLANQDYFARGLAGLADAHRCVREIRGTGYFYAIDLMADRHHDRELTADQKAGLEGGMLGHFVREARVLVRPDDRGATMMMVSPPLVADRTVLDDLFASLDQVLDRTEAWLAVN